jgi:pyridoxal phosphate enzyme (YggS family)
VSIVENLDRVRSRIDAAARRSGREPADVTLVAVSKTFDANAVREAWAAGQRDFGENRVQEALQKIAATSDISARWHLVGHLQSNKAKKAVGPFACIHSIDSMELMRHVANAAAGADEDTAPEVLIQVDFAGETTKFGAPPDEAERLVRAAAETHDIRLRGLMLMPPWNEDQEQTRPWFVRLREFRDRLLSSGVPSTALQHLSMGMSHDFEAAIEEGATIVRVGSAIFGNRSRA